MHGNVLLESRPAYWTSQLCISFSALFDSCSTYAVLLPHDVVGCTGLSYGILFSVVEALCLACPGRSGLYFPKGYITNICAHKTVEGLYFLNKQTHVFYKYILRILISCLVVTTVFNHVRCVNKTIFFCPRAQCLSTAFCEFEVAFTNFLHNIRVISRGHVVKR